MGAHLLSLLVFTPLAGAACAFLLPRRAARAVATAAALAPALFALWGLAHRAEAGAQAFVVRAPWIRTLQAEYHVGADGTALVLAALVALLVSVAAWSDAGPERGARARLGLLLVCEVGALGALVSQDAFLLFTCWETAWLAAAAGAVLGRERGEERDLVRRLALGAVAAAPLLVGLVALRLDGGTSSLPALLELARGNRLGGAHSPGGGVLLGLAFAHWSVGCLLVACVLRLGIAPFASSPARGRRRASEDVVLLAVLPLLAAAVLMRVGLPLCAGHARAVALSCAILGVLALVANALALGRERDPARRVESCSAVQLGLFLFAVGSLSGWGARAAELQLVHFGLSVAALVLASHAGRFAPLAWLAALGLPGFSGAAPLFLAFRGALSTSHPLFLWLAPLAAVAWSLVLQAAWRTLPPVVGPVADGLAGRRSAQGVAALLAASAVVGLYPPLVLAVSGASLDRWLLSLGALP